MRVSRRRSAVANAGGARGRVTLRSAVIAAMLAGGAARAASAQELLRGYLGGGVTEPIGSLAGSTRGGYNILLGVAARAPFTRLSLRLDGMFSELTQAHHAPAYAQFASGNLNVQYTLIAGPLAPYLFAGPGYYFFRGDNVAALGVAPNSGNPPFQSSHFGADGGLGVRYRLRRFSLFLEARDEFVLLSGSERTYLPVTAGISVPYPWGEPGTSGVR